MSSYKSSVDWSTAPSWAKWHSTDPTGKVWWEKRPLCDGKQYYRHSDTDVGEYLWYETYPDGALYIRLEKRPKR